MFHFMWKCYIIDAFKKLFTKYQPKYCNLTRYIICTITYFCQSLSMEKLTHISWGLLDMLVSLYWETTMAITIFGPRSLITIDKSLKDIIVRIGGTLKKAHVPFTGRLRCNFKQLFRLLPPIVPGDTCPQCRHMDTSSCARNTNRLEVYHESLGTTRRDFDSSRG